jgi:hypothetical protein
MIKHADVTLQRWQVAYAMEEAQRRDENATLNRRRHGTTSTAGLPSIDAHRIGTVTELAVATYTGLEERFFDENVLDAPDVGLIEVRGTRKRDADLRVYAGDVTKASYMVLGYVLDLEEAGAVIRLAGWAHSEHAWNYAKPAPFAPHPKRGQARFHSARSLHPMTTLMKNHTFEEEWINERILTR